MTTGVYKRTEETKKKMSKRMMGNTYRLGNTLTEKTKKKLSKASKGEKNGFYGKHHTKEIIEVIRKAAKKRKQTKETKKKMSEALRGKMPKYLQKPGKWRHIKRGYFNINNKKMFFRSKWEANYALYLNFLVKQKQIKKWEYEPDVFVFEKVKFGTRSYRPDFKVYNDDENFEYHEVKGYMDSRSKTKIKRMAKYYPDIKLLIIDKEVYNDIKDKLGKMLKFY